MSKSAKRWLIAAAVLVVVGLIVFAAVMAVCRWDFSRLSTDQFETDTYELSGEFSSIAIDSESADIAFEASGDDMCRVVCYDQKNVEYSAGVQGGTLAITAEDSREWYEHISINIQVPSPKITVYLPKNEYDSLVINATAGDIEIPEEFSFESADITLTTGGAELCASVSETAKISVTTGDVWIEGITAGALDLSASTGEITVCDVTCAGDVKTGITTGSVRVKNVTCRNFFSTGSTSDIFLMDTVCEEKISVERTTGDIMFEDSDAGEIFAKTSTGSIVGSLLTEKVFLAEASTGSVSVPKTTAGGKCELITSTGDIKIRIAGKGK